MARTQFRPIVFSLVMSIISGLLVLGSGATHAQWTFRTAPEPYVRSVSVFRDTPAAGTTTLIANTLGAGVFKGIDTGASWTWQGINNGLPTGRIWTLNAVDINTFYAGTDGYGIYKTTDGGNNWLPLNGSGATALGCMEVRDIEISGTTLYASTRCRYNSGVYKSTNAGVTWARIGTTVIPSDVEGGQLTLNTSGTLVLFTTGNYGIFKSSDSGSTWVQANTGIAGANPSVPTSIVCSTSSSCATLLVFVRGQGIYKSTNTGATWTLSSTGLPTGAVRLGGISRDTSTTPPIFYLPLDKQGTYRSTNEGATWTLWGNTASRPEAAFFRNVNRDRSAPGKFYLGTLDGVHKTLDDGLNFTSSAMGSGRLGGIVHDIANPAVAYLTTAATLIRNSNIYAADPNSVSARIDSGITGATLDGSFAQDTKNPNVLYQTTNNRGIFKSVDGGATWNAINTGLPSVDSQSAVIAIDRNNSQIIYLGFARGAGLYKTTNGGAGWSAANAGLTSLDAKFVNRIAIDRNNSSTLYAATDDGLYKSTDSAANWALVYSALDSGGKRLLVNHVRVNPSNSQEIYIANPHTDPNGALLGSAGIQKSTNGGSTWTNVLPGKNASSVRVSQGGEILAGINAAIGQPAVFRSTDGGASWQEYTGGLLGSDIASFGIDPNNDRVISLALENGFYTLAVSTPVAPATPLPPPPATQAVFTAPAGEIPEAAVQVSAAGTFGSATLKVTLDIVKVLQKTAATGFAASVYNVYVIALVPGAAFGSAAPFLFVKPKAPGNWGVLQFPLAAFLEGVAENSVNTQIVIEILTNTDISSLAGAEFYVGYGLSDQEMLATGRYRGVFKAQ